MEDEKHFILNCPQYQLLEENIKSFLDVDDDIHSIRKLLNPTNTKSAREICSFLKEAFEINKFDSVSAGPIQIQVYDIKGHL